MSSCVPGDAEPGPRDIKQTVSPSVPEPSVWLGVGPWGQACTQEPLAMNVRMVWVEAQEARQARSPQEACERLGAEGTFGSCQSD